MPSPAIPATPIVLGEIDRGFNAKWLLINMINAVVHNNYPTGSTFFTEPVKLPNGSLCNTSIQVYSNPENPLYPTRNVYYNRVHTTDLGPAIVPSLDMLFVNNILSSFNSIYGSYIKARDIIDELLPPPDSFGNVTVFLKFAPICLQFYSGDKIIVNNPNSLEDTTRVLLDIELVDNTPDLAKPVSVPQATAIANVLSTAEAYANNLVNNIDVSALVNGENIIYDSGNF